MILYSQWLQLPISRRHEIAAIFGIEKKGPTEVFNDTIKSDGYMIKDIEEKINLYTLQKYLGTEEENLTVLWSYLNDKLDGKEITIIDIPLTPSEPLPVVEEPILDEKIKKSRKK